MSEYFRKRHTRVVPWSFCRELVPWKPNSLAI